MHQTRKAIERNRKSEANEEQTDLYVKDTNQSATTILILTLKNSVTLL